MTGWIHPTSQQVPIRRCEIALVVGEKIAGSDVIFDLEDSAMAASPHWYQLSFGEIVFCDNVWVQTLDPISSHDMSDDAGDAIEIERLGKHQRVLLVCEEDTLCTVPDKC